MKRVIVLSACGCVLMTGVTSTRMAWGQEDESRDAATPSVNASVVPRNVVCNQGGNPLYGDCFEVYAESLADMPIMLELGLGGSERLTGTPLRKEGMHWYDLFRIETDAAPGQLGLTVVPGSERVTLSERLTRMDHRLSADVPTTLEQKDGASVLVHLRGPDHGEFGPGVYKFTGSFAPGAKEFFGASPSMTLDFSITVKARDTGDEDYYIEHQIERHILCGAVLQLRDMPEAADVLRKGLALSKGHLAESLASDDSVFNLTPPYQAALLCSRLGLTNEAISYLVQAYQGASVTCKWQRYHFGQSGTGETVGDMPRRAKDTIRRMLSRLRREAQRDVDASTENGSDN